MDKQMNEDGVLAEEDITDEDRIQRGINNFYTLTEMYDGDMEKIRQLKLIRNNVINMTDTYLKKFNNSFIMGDFYKKLKNAKKNAIENGYINKYKQYMNEIRVIQEFKGIQQDIAEKLGDQLFEKWNKWRIRNAEISTDDTN